jgi:hypothetical protein
MVLALAGCSTSNSSSGGDGGSAGDASTGAYATSTCGTCVAQSCSAAITKCNSDPDCSAYLACLDACGVGPDGNVDPTCAAACPTGSSSAGTTAEATLNNCRAIGPGAQCAGCGIDGGGANPILTQMCTPMTDTTPCFTCEDDQCCDTYARCHANADCHALQTCIVDCQNHVADDAGAPEGGATATETCAYICGKAHPQGLVDWAPRTTCIFVKCLVQCENPPMPPPSPCIACQNQNCANEYANLVGTPDGYLFAACVAGCPTGSPCEEACFTQYPSAKAAANAQLACSSLYCPACGAGD